MLKQYFVITLVLLSIWAGIVHADNIAPVISEVNLTIVRDTVAVIIWKTDEPSTSIIQYDISSYSWDGYIHEIADSELVIDHVITITNLQPDTLYYFRVGSIDSEGNGPSLSTLDMNPSVEFNLMTQQGPDLIAPQIIGDVWISYLSDRTAVIEWTTDEPGDSQVRYDITSNEWDNYDFIINDDTFTTEHRITLTDLLHQTVYFVRVSSTDASGNDATTSLIDNNPSIEYNIFYLDADRDYLDDNWEERYGLDPTNSDTTVGEGGSGDFDHDGYSNYEELLNGTDPTSVSIFTVPAGCLLSGSISDAITNSPIKNAVISLQSSDTFRVIDNNYLGVIQPGNNYIVDVSADGYQTISLVLDIPEVFVISHDFQLLDLNSPMQASITFPSTDLEISVGKSSNFHGMVSGVPPFSYIWNFDGATHENEVLKFIPGPVTFRTPGSYTVTFTVTDATKSSAEDTITVIAKPDGGGSGSGCFISTIFE